MHVSGLLPGLARDVPVLLQPHEAGRSNDQPGAVRRATRDAVRHAGGVSRGQIQGVSVNKFCTHPSDGTQYLESAEQVLTSDFLSQRKRQKR